MSGLNKLKYYEFISFAGRQEWRTECFLAKQNSCVPHCSLSLMISKPTKRWLWTCTKSWRGRKKKVWALSFTPFLFFASQLDGHFFICSLQLHPWLGGSELRRSLGRCLCSVCWGWCQPWWFSQSHQSKHQGENGMLRFSGDGWVSVRLALKSTPGSVASNQTLVCSGSNILLARLATRKAKPDGQYFLRSEEVDDFIRDLPVTSLPGI